MTESDYIENKENNCTRRKKEFKFGDDPFESIVLNQIKRSSNMFDVLGVNSNTNDQEVRRNYKTLITKLHPDKSRNNETSQAFQKVKEAYENLRDRESRDNYKKIIENKKKSNFSSSRKSSFRNFNNKQEILFFNIIQKIATLSIIILTLIVPLFLIMLFFQNFSFSSFNIFAKKRQNFSLQFSEKYSEKRVTSVNNYIYWISKDDIEAVEESWISIEKEVEEAWLDKERIKCLNDLQREIKIKEKLKNGKSRKEREYYQNKLNNFESYICMQYDKRQNRFNNFFLNKNI